MTKKFLVPVLALAMFGVTARASLVEYCDGFGCGSNTTSAFITAVTASGDTYASVSDITFAPGSLLSSTEYLDSTLVAFVDTNGTFTVNGTALDTTVGGNANTVQITIPAAYSAVALYLVDINGTSGFYLDSNESDYVTLSSTPTMVGYTNFGGSGSWTIAILPGSTSADLGIASFNPAGTQSQGSDTPEVGTLLLIGAGLISMRWMRRAQLRFFGPPQTT